MARFKFLFFAAVLAGFTALAYAGFDDGKAAYDRADTAKSCEELKPLAEQRLAELQIDLGVMYNFGLGEKQEYGEAVKFYRGEAELGNAGAQYHLGLMYARGRGVPQDSIEAAKWYRKAAEHGHAVAQHDLGVMYLDGEGVPQDFVQAHMWLDLAAAQGDQRSQQLRDEVARKMTASEIAEAQRLASGWKAKGRD
ncbi:MAG: tetratricopeptide repeat protein [Syntrophobacteraceae bacterium]